MSLQRLVSGIQPSGRLHIGNYLGVLKSLPELQNSGRYECYFFLADLHSLTESYSPAEKKQQILELAADLFAAGLDPQKSTIFQQSAVESHTVLSWIFSTITPMGELRRMTQFKDKAKKAAEHGAEIIDTTNKIASDRNNNAVEFSKDFQNQLHVSKPEIDSVLEDGVANVGLFTYPVLMAADILMYNPSFVPVGSDQLQHLELTRTIARKFNTKFGELFIEPQPLLTATPRIMSLKDPTKKMSKSTPAGCLFVDDEPDVIMEKLKGAVTDSGNEIVYDPLTKPAIANIIDIVSGITGKSPVDVAHGYAGMQYSEFKTAVAEQITDAFAHHRTMKKELLADPEQMTAWLGAGAERAEEVAAVQLDNIKEAIGIALD